MKENITFPWKDVLAWWKENSSRFPLIAKAARIVLATPASEAICQRLFKRAKHIGTTDRIARPDETFEMLVIAQYNLARHGSGIGGNRGEHDYYVISGLLFDSALPGFSGVQVSSTTARAGRAGPA